MGNESTELEPLMTSGDDLFQPNSTGAKPTVRPSEKISQTAKKFEDSQIDSGITPKNGIVKHCNLAANSSQDNGEFLVKYKGRRYDIQNLLKKHPGGSKILKFYKGLSIDEAMVTNTHSVAAFHLFEEFVEGNQEAYQEIEVSVLRRLTRGKISF